MKQRGHFNLISTRSDLESNSKNKKKKDTKIRNWVLLKPTIWRNVNISSSLSVPTLPLWGPEGFLNTRPACGRPRSQRAGCFLFCLCWDFDLISSAYPKPSSCCLNSWSSLGAEGSNSSPLRTRETTDGGRAWEPERREGWPSSDRVVKPQTSCPRAPRDGHTEPGPLEKLYLLSHCFYAVRHKLNHHKFAH